MRPAGPGSGGANLSPLPPVALGGGSPQALTNVFGHLADPPLTPDQTLGYGQRVGDPSSFSYNLGGGRVVPTLGADQTGQVTAGLNLPSGTSIGAGINPQGVAQGQLGQNFNVGGGQLNVQGNAATDGTVGGQIAWQRGNLRVGLNGVVNTQTGDANVGGGVSLRF